MVTHGNSGLLLISTCTCMTLFEPGIHLHVKVQFANEVLQHIKDERSDIQGTSVSNFPV